MVDNFGRIYKGICTSTVNGLITQVWFQEIRLLINFPEGVNVTRKDRKIKDAGRSYIVHHESSQEMNNLIKNSGAEVWYNMDEQGNVFWVVGKGSDGDELIGRLEKYYEFKREA
jgi:hypothetical protein